MAYLLYCIRNILYISCILVLYTIYPYPTLQYILYCEFPILCIIIYPILFSVYVHTFLYCISYISPIYHTLYI
jgi:hypothetical protein